MIPRFIITTKESMFELIRDFVGNQIPADAIPKRILMQPNSNGKLAIEFESSDLTSSADINVHFRLLKD